MFQLGDKVLINTGGTEYFIYQGTVVSLDSKVHYVLDNTLSGDTVYPPDSKSLILGCSCSDKCIPYRMSLQTAYFWLNKKKWYNEIFNTECVLSLKQTLKINKILSKALIDYKKYDIMYYDDPTIAQSLTVLQAISDYVSGAIETLYGKSYVKLNSRWLTIQHKSFVLFDSVLGLPVAKSTLPLYEIDNAIRYLKGEV